MLAGALAAVLASAALAQSEGGEAEQEDSARQIPCPDEIPGPANLNADGGDQRIAVTWNDVDFEDASFSAEYFVVVSGTGGGSTTTSGTSASFTGLTNGETYRISVQTIAVWDLGGRCSGSSARTTATPLAKPPSPGGLGVSKGTNSFTFTWNSLSGASKYEYEFSIDGGVEDSGETTGTSASFIPVKGFIACDLTYRFRVRAYGDGTTYAASWGGWASKSYREGCDPRGVVTLSTNSPQVGTAITATLSDASGGVTNVTWQWSTSSGNISGATSSSYTPVAGDRGKKLTATASYTDAHGPNKTASKTTTSAVPTVDPIRACEG